MEAATAVWFFVLGASVGSFLNVVVHRMPLGLSLGRPPSRCPGCGTRILPRDNVPILGWLLLRGRCRACRTRISARYPLVEGGVALLFLALLYVELLSGGRNLPVRKPNSLHGIAWILWDPQWDLIALYLYHEWLLCTLLAIVLMTLDRARIPRRLLVVTGLLGLLAPVVVPTLHPVPLVVAVPHWIEATRWIWWSPGLGIGESFRLGPDPRGALDGLAGLTAGLSAGGVLAVAAPSGPEGAAARRGLVAVLGLSGVFLGWQAAVSVAALAAPCLAAARWLQAGRQTPLPAAVYVAMPTAAALLQILAWDALSDVPWWPSHRSSAHEIAAAAAVALALALAARFAPHPSRPPAVQAAAREE